MRVTEFWSTSLNQSEAGPRIRRKSQRRRRAAVVAVALGATTLVAAGGPSRAQTGSASLQTSLDLSMQQVPVGSTDGQSVTPTVGPSMATVVSGSGSIGARGSGRYFLAGGQQRTDTAYVTTNASIDTLIDGSAGSVSITSVSRTSLAARTSISGRNRSTLVHVVSHGEASVENDVVRVDLVTESGETPFLAANVNGVSDGIALTGANARRFNAGSRTALSVQWSNGTATLRVGNIILKSWTIPATPTVWGAGARLAIGASADWGGGYFSSRHDAIERVVVARPKNSVTTTVPTTAAPTTAVPTTAVPTTAPSTTVASTTTSIPVSGYPAQWEWLPGATDDQPLPATDGQPLIKQIRNGQVIATYTRLGGGDCTWVENTVDNPVTDCGAFSRYPYANKRPGDIFEVYPAVYEGADQQPYIGPNVDNYANFLAGIKNVPANITIRGVTVNGKRPVLRLGATGGSNNTLGQSMVYVDQSSNVLIENIDLDGSGGGSVGKSGIYVNGVNNITLRNMRIHGFRAGQTNGIFATSSNQGTLRIDRVHLFDNGGGNGPEHNIYINASAVDPNWTVHMTNSMSTSVYYGHLFKSRAQVNILEGNYLKGTVPFGGESIAETFLVDVPNGTRLTMRNNILVKNKSGDGSNGYLVNFAAEGLVDNRPLSVLIEHNTFVTFAADFDTQGHPIVPMNFFYPSKIPGSSGFPIADFTVRNNVFVGFRADAVVAEYYPAALFRGAGAVAVGFDGLRQDFSLTNPVPSSGSSIIGTPAYSYRTVGGRVRQRATVGAVD